MLCLGLIPAMLVTLIACSRAMLMTQQESVEGAPLDEILRAGVAAGTATVTTFGQISFTKEKFDEIYANIKVEEF